MTKTPLTTQRTSVVVGGRRTLTTLQGVYNRKQQREANRPKTCTRARAGARTTGQRLVQGRELERGQRAKDLRTGASWSEASGPKTCAWARAGARPTSQRLAHGREQEQGQRAKDLRMGASGSKANEPKTCAWARAGARPTSQRLAHGRELEQGQRAKDLRMGARGSEATPAGRDVRKNVGQIIQSSFCKFLGGSVIYCGKYGVFR